MVSSPKKFVTKDGYTIQGANIGNFDKRDKNLDQECIGLAIVNATCILLMSSSECWRLRF